MGPEVEKEQRCDFKGRPANIGREKRASEEFGSRELGLSVSAAAQGVAGCGVIGFDLHHTACFFFQHGKQNNSKRVGHPAASLPLQHGELCCELD